LGAWLARRRDTRDHSGASVDVGGAPLDAEKIEVQQLQQAGVAAGQPILEAVGPEQPPKLPTEFEHEMRLRGEFRAIPERPGWLHPQKSKAGAEGINK